MAKAEEKKMTITISTQTIFKVLVIAIVIAFVWFVRDIVLMLFLAILLAALIEPAVSWLHHHKVPRALSVLAIYVVLAAVAVLALVAIIPPLLEQFEQLTTNLAGQSGAISDWINHAVATGNQLGLGKEVATSLAALQSTVNDLASNLFSTVTNVVGAVVALVIVMMMAFYIVVDEDSWRRVFRRLAPDEYQPYLSQLFTRMQNKIGLWLRGQLLLMLIVGVSVYVGLLILNVPYALVLGLFAALMELIPFVGPTVSAALGVSIAFVSSPLKALIVLIFYIIMQQTEANILIPKIMQRVTGLNPIVSIVALLIGFKVGGAAGAAISIPLATMLSVFVYDILGNKEPLL